MELLLCLNVWTCSLLFWWQSLIVKRIVAKCLQLDNTPLFLALSLSFTHCHLYPSCFSGLSVSQCFYLICLICSFSFLFLSLSPPYSLCIHVFSVQSSWASPFLLSLPCMHRHTQTHSYVLSISTRWRRCSCSQADWVVSWGRRMEGGKDWRSSYALTSVERNNSWHPQHVLLCERLIFLRFHVFVFIIFYFLYRLCDQSLMHSLAFVSWKLSRVQNAYL